MYKFFIEWREGNIASSIITKNYSIESTALYLYDVKELTKEADIKNIPQMVIPFSSIRYFTYEER